MSVVESVRRSLTLKLEALAAEGVLGDVDLAGVAAWTIERPKRAEHGDYATNVAMVLAKPAKKPPRVIAEALAKALLGDEIIAGAEVAGPGFVNLRLHASVLHRELATVLETGRGYGRAPAATGERINLELVSANPTGPITVASARNAIFGDAVASVLEACGHRVTREYYINDFGNQVRLFAESVVAQSQGKAVPEGGYQGGYVLELADWLKKVDPAALEGDLASLSRACIAWMLRGIPGSDMLRGIKRSLADLGVFFDVWYSEESLHRWGAVATALAQLEQGGYLVRKDGALFFVGKGAEADDKDRVVQKSDGAYTYFASDIAYHADKIGRGYDRLINVLGVDHHGYVARMRNALEALGLQSELFEALLYNLVYVFRAGEAVKSSKRAGNVVTAEEIIEEIDAAAGRQGAGRDALRFFYLSRSATQPVDFDIEVAKKKSLDNPVFYVQYGHARLCSILAKARSIGITPPAALSPEAWSALVHPDELSLASKVSDFPLVVAQAAASREPHKVVFYVQELAHEFQSYFTRMKGDPILPPDSARAEPAWQDRWDMNKTLARLAWVEAVRVVYASALELLGISAPERMERPAEATDQDPMEQGP